MISKKRLYSEQILQLVLALSLLHVDPINYLEWSAPRIHNQGNGPWQLEMTHTQFSDYPYMNRKHYVPLIEDLTRYDRIRSHDVQAYLLNLSDDPPSFIAASNNNINNNTTSSSNNTSSTSSIVNISDNSNLGDSAAALVNLIQDRFQDHGNVDDIFLQSDLFAANTESILDQNLADLNDYEERQHNLPHFLAVPTKNELPDSWDEALALRENATTRDNARGARRLDVVLGSSGISNETGAPPTFTRTAVIDWHDYIAFINDSTVVEIKKERQEQEEDEHSNVLVRKEETTDDDSNFINNAVKIETEDDSSTSSTELTSEEIDLIEALWKQDVDLGYNPIVPTLNAESLQKEANSADDLEKLKALLELKTDKKSEDEGKPQDEASNNPWAGLSYVIDTETGEYILQANANGNSNELDNLLLEEALQLVGITDDLNTDKKDQSSEENQLDEAAALEVLKSGDSNSGEVSDDLEAILENNLHLECGKDDFDFDLNSPLSNLLDDTEELDLLNEMMIQPSTPHFQHPRQPSQNYAHCVNSYRQNGYQGRVPLSRTVSMEQRWQDLANLLSFPPAMGMGVGDMSSHAAHYSSHYPYQASGSMSQHGQFSHHHPHSHPAVLHNASLAEIAAQPSSSHHLQPYSSNLGSAVASSMHLTNSTSETDAGNSTYKMEHDLMYYSHPNPSELNHTSDGFLNSILNDEDLQLMDMAVNEGMYTMRMIQPGLDQSGNSSNNASSIASNAQLMGNHMQTNLSLSSGIGASTSASQQHGDRLDASSDSAVSSMGSERVASLSDGEWNEAGSDSAQEYHTRKFIGPYDYRFNNSRMMDTNRQPVAQKKHQMYGKRFAHESSLLPPPSLHPSHQNLGTDLTSVPNVPLKYEPYEPYAIPSNNLDGPSSSVIKPPASLMDSEMKYSYSIDFPHQRHLKSGSGSNGISSHDLINHNHTYTMPHPGGGSLNGNGATPRPQTRDKKVKKAEEEHLTRDEKRARALHIPIPVQDIINLPMDEFNERLSKYDLSENQLSLIRDIRRRGKNKVAAQNCRKRKLDQIISLADEVKDMKMRKERFLRERELALSERRRVRDKFAELYRHVFQNLRDADGNPYSSYQYSLQQSADGSVVLVPRSEQNSTENANGTGSSSRNNGNHSSSGPNNNSTNFK